MTYGFDADPLPAKDAEALLQQFDGCWCGDYRHQHDATGCRVCRTMPGPANGCRGFKLVTAATEIPEPYRSSKWIRKAAFGS